jgi:hypothetical protein
MNSCTQEKQPQSLRSRQTSGGSIVANWNGATVTGPTRSVPVGTSIPFVAPASLLLWGSPVQEYQFPHERISFMNTFFNILVEYPVQWLSIFGGTVLAIVTLVTRKRIMSYKSKWFIVSILFGCLLIVINGFLHMDIDLNAIRP